MRWALFCVGLMACGLADRLAGGAPATSPAEVKPPAPKGDVLFAFVVKQAGRSSGTRVLDDGHIQLTADGDASRWIDDGKISDSAMEELQKLLATEEVRKLPETLPDDAVAPKDGPPAEWSLRVGDTLRLVSVAHYGGVRVPILERLQRVIRDGRDTSGSFNTAWTVHIGDQVLRADVLCQPMQVPQLKPMVAAMLDPTLPVVAAGSPAAPEFLRIDWRDGQVEWTTTLLMDGSVLRGRPDKSVQIAKLDDVRFQAVRQTATAFDWTRAAALCPARGAPSPTP